jgi:hypothetical protein
MWGQIPVVLHQHPNNPQNENSIKHIQLCITEQWIQLLCIVAFKLGKKLIRLKLEFGQSVSVLDVTESEVVTDFLSLEVAYREFASRFAIDLNLKAI